ncbi:macrophage mannose receptor 1 [Hydra vulgaris]|uniref:macrophage mannose receptor 1 n=1 Tax=Hydra vulgaris TaxID=6087 RepID=UPI00019272C8|nr:macrophage mannose receptor 1 [Hydra vulgaris]
MIVLFVMVGVFVAGIDTILNPCESDDWKYYKNYCYWSSSYHPNPLLRKTNWFNAARECRKKNADLVSIHNRDENDIVYKMNMCADSWIGLIMIDYNLKTIKTGWEWLDSTEQNYLNWNSGYPRREYYECNFMSMSNSDGEWVNNLHCGNVRNFYVCKTKAKFNLNVTIIKPNLCDRGWIAVGSKCYMVNMTKVDYFESRIQCQLQKGKLVTLRNSKEESDLTKAFDGCDTPWIGLENVDPSKVGENIGWKWSDGSLVDYQNWKDNGITRDQTKQCGILQRGKKWDNVPCWELHPFVCERVKDNPSLPNKIH